MSDMSKEGFRESEKMGKASESGENRGFPDRPALAPLASRPMIRLTPPPTTGPEVEELQSILTTKGFQPGPVDGVFGTRTDLAVKLFQHANDLVEDGIVGPKTWAKLEE